MTFTGFVCNACLVVKHQVVRLDRARFYVRAIDPGVAGGDDVHFIVTGFVRRVRGGRYRRRFCLGFPRCRRRIFFRHGLADANEPTLTSFENKIESGDVAQQRVEQRLFETGSLFGLWILAVTSQNKTCSPSVCRLVMIGLLIRSSPDVPSASVIVHPA